MEFDEPVKKNIERRRTALRKTLENEALAHFPRDQVREVLAHWSLRLSI